MPDGAAYPWPRAMREPLAAHYCGVSPSTFRARIAPHIPSVRVTDGCVAWYREDLDAWLDRRAGRAPAAAPSPSAEPAATGETNDPIAAGLAALRPAQRRPAGAKPARGR
jgi:predicted DNA-binding transcriptional regulator AlpA